MRRSEPKLYAIKAARKPTVRHGFSNVVVVDDGSELSYCHIDYADDLLEAVGSRLPRGASSHDPSHLLVKLDKQRAVWVVYAQYLDRSAVHVLWESAAKPTWLKRAKAITG